MRQIVPYAIRRVTADAGPPETWLKDDLLTALAIAMPSALPPLISVSRAAELLGIARTTGYELARSGQLPGVTKLGSRFVVRTAVFTRWLDGQSDAQ
jgi:excisionase family DNA binding protein